MGNIAVAAFDPIFLAHHVKPRRTFDPRPAHPLTPATKVVIATEAVTAALGGGAETMTVTVVPLVTSLTEKCSCASGDQPDREVQR